MFRTFAALALIAAVAACSDSTGPQNFDAVTTTNKADAVVAALSGNPALTSLSVLAPAIQLSAVQPALALVPFDPTDPSVSTADRMESWASLLPSFGATGTLALFPVDLLGKTFAYDTALGRYALDDAATGAPATGVRFILYAVDPVAGQVVLPLNPVGYLDLTDVSSPSADAVRIVAVVGSTTYLDYTASAAQGTTSTTLSAVGYVSNGTDQVDVDLSLTGTQTQVIADYQLSNSDGLIHLQVTFDSSASVTATLTLQGDGNTVQLSLTFTPSTISGEITYNGDVVVTVAGTPNSPTFTRPDGTALSQAEINALVAFGSLIDQIFDTFDNLLAPAVVVLAIG